MKTSTRLVYTNIRLLLKLNTIALILDLLYYVNTNIRSIILHKHWYKTNYMTYILI